MSSFDTAVIPLTVFCVLQLYRWCRFSIMGESIMITLICAPYFLGRLHPKETREIGTQTDGDTSIVASSRKTFNVDVKPIIPFVVAGLALSVYTTYGL